MSVTATLSGVVKVAFLFVALLCTPSYTYFTRAKDAFDGMKFTLQGHRMAGLDSMNCANETSPGTQYNDTLLDPNSIHILMVASPDFLRANQHAATAKQMFKFYADVYGYNFRIVDPTPIANKFRTALRISQGPQLFINAKPYVMLYYFKETYQLYGCSAKWVLFLDADVLITNFGRSLESLIYYADAMFFGQRRKSRRNSYSTFDSNRGRSEDDSDILADGMRNGSTASRSSRMFATEAINSTVYTTSSRNGGTSTETSPDNTTANSSTTTTTTANKSDGGMTNDAWSGLNAFLLDDPTTVGTRSLSDPQPLSQPLSDPQSQRQSVVRVGGGEQSCHIIAQLGSVTINTGVLFFRVSPQAEAALANWVHVTQQHIEANIKWQGDQGRFQEVYLQYLQEVRGIQLPFNCSAKIINHGVGKELNNNLRNNCFAKNLLLVNLLPFRSPHDSMKKTADTVGTAGTTAGSKASPSTDDVVGTGDFCMVPFLSDESAFNLHDVRGHCSLFEHKFEFYPMVDLDKRKQRYGQCRIRGPIFYHGKNIGVTLNIQRSFAKFESLRDDLHENSNETYLGIDYQLQRRQQLRIENRTSTLARGNSYATNSTAAAAGKPKAGKPKAGRKGSSTASSTASSTGRLSLYSGRSRSTDTGAKTFARSRVADRGTLGTRDRGSRRQLMRSRSLSSAAQSSSSRAPPSINTYSNSDGRGRSDGGSGRQGASAGRALYTPHQSYRGYTSSYMSYPTANQAKAMLGSANSSEDVDSIMQQLCHEELLHQLQFSARATHWMSKQWKDIASHIMRGAKWQSSAAAS